MSGPHPDDCLGCAINRIIRRLAKESCGECINIKRCGYCAGLRKFGRSVAREVQKEVERRHAETR